MQYNLNILNMALCEVISPFFLSYERSFSHNELSLLEKLNYKGFLLLQPIVAVPSFICADAFNKFLPFCTGFAAGCMIWMVVAEVLPDAFKVMAYLSTYGPS